MIIVRIYILAIIILFIYILLTTDLSRLIVYGSNLSRNSTLSQHLCSSRKSCKSFGSSSSLTSFFQFRTKEIFGCIPLLKTCRNYLVCILRGYMSWWNGLTKLLVNFAQWCWDWIWVAIITHVVHVLYNPGSSAYKNLIVNELIFPNQYFSVEYQGFIFKVCISTL